MNLKLHVEVDPDAIRQAVADHLINLAHDITGKPYELKPRAPAAEAGQDLEWSPTLCDGQSVKNKAAEKAIDTLNAKLGTDEPRWRIPSRVELESILDLTRSDPAVDIQRFPDTKSGYYWASTPLASDPSYAWLVSFGLGYVYYLHRDGDLAFVRAVRSVPAGQ